MDLFPWALLFIDSEEESIIGRFSLQFHGQLSGYPYWIPPSGNTNKEVFRLLLLRLLCCASYLYYAIITTNLYN